MMSEEVQANSELGTIRIADEVVAVIAGLAATQVEGVASMSGGIAGGIAEALGRRNFSKGVKVEVGSEEAIINLYIIVKYGFRSRYSLGDTGERQESRGEHDRSPGGPSERPRSGGKLPPTERGFRAGYGRDNR